MGKYKLTIETYMGAGRYQHKVTENGLVERVRGTELSDKTLAILKAFNETVWEGLPEGAGPVISTITLVYGKSKK